MNAKEARDLMLTEDTSVYTIEIDDKIRSEAILGSIKLSNVFSLITVNKRDESSIIRHYSEQGFNITITPHEGHEVDEENSTFQCIKFKELPKKKEVKCWDDLSNVDGYFVSSLSTISEHRSQTLFEKDKNVCQTKEQAEGLLALSQLSQLYYEFTKDDELLIIDASSYFEIEISTLLCIRHIITIHNGTLFVFKNKTDAEQFLKLHFNLFKQACVWY